MIFSHTRYPLLALVLLSLSVNSSLGAEEDLVLLTIGDSLIGTIDSFDREQETAQQSAELIGAYHQLLSSDVRFELEALHEELLKLIPGFEVAYAAADSAEIAHVMSEMDMRLASIQDIHATSYTDEVLSLLTAAYQSILPTFGDEQ